MKYKRANPSWSYVLDCLVHLIAGMTQSEARVFKDYIEKERTTNRYGSINLFQDLKRGRSAQTILQKEYNGNSDNFNGSCKRLRKKVINKLAVKHYGSVDFAYKVAFDKGLIRLGAFLLEKRLLAAWQNQDLPETFSLARRVMELQQAYRVKVSYPKTLPPIQDLGKEIELQVPKRSTSQLRRLLYWIARC